MLYLVKETIDYGDYTADTVFAVRSTEEKAWARAKEIAQEKADLITRNGCVGSLKVEEGKKFPMSITVQRNYPQHPTNAHTVINEEVFTVEPMDDHD